MYKMPYYIASVKYDGTALIVIEADEKPKSFESFRKSFNAFEVDMGVPRFYTKDAEIEETDEETYKRIKRLMEQNAKKQEAIFPKKKTLANLIKKTAQNMKNSSNFQKTLNNYTKRLEQFTDKGDLKEITMSIASDINDHPGLDSIVKKMLVGLAMDYKNKTNLSKEDVLTFIGYVKNFLES